MTQATRARANRFIARPEQRSARSSADPSNINEVLDHSSIISRGKGKASSVLSSVIKLVGSLVVVLGSASGLTWSVYHYATTSARFAIKDIQVRGGVRLSNDQVLAASGVARGDNLFKLSVAGVEKRLLANPWVAQVRVTRQLPSTVAIELHEREATALALVMGQLYLVNRHGETFKPATAEDPSDLPLITGVEVPDGPRDPSLYRQRIGVALDVLSHFSQSHLGKAYAPEEVHLTPGGEAVFTIGHKGTTLYLGAGPWSKKFAMAERILARLQAQRSNPALIFMDNKANPNRVVVRLN
jgi:cell division protein FtsQ